MARRGATDLAGVLVTDKPAGCTSHDVIARIRRATGEKRIGHAGTLDPMATGVLIVLIGSATRLERYLSGHDKTYAARIRFGETTDTLDAEGEVTETAPVPESVYDPAAALGVLERLTGPSLQMPPDYSAIKRGGVAAHRIARSGGTPALESRPVIVHEAVLDAIDPVQGTWDITVSVSKGTYVRALARDIGRAAGTVAHLTSLRRTRSGHAEIGTAVPLDAAVGAAEAGDITRLFSDPLALLGLPTCAGASERVRSGRVLPAGDDAPEEGSRCAIVADGRLMAVYLRQGDTLRAETVLDPEIAL